METVVLNNTEYDVLVEEEARLIRLVFYDTDDDDNGYDGDDIGDDEGTCESVIMITMMIMTTMITMMMITQTGGGQVAP